MGGGTISPTGYRWRGLRLAGLIVPPPTAESRIRDNPYNPRSNSARLIRPTACSGVAVGSEHLQIDGGFSSGDELGDEQTANGRHRQAEHGVAAGGGQIGVVFQAADVRQAVRSDGPVTEPRLDAGEIRRGEVWKKRLRSRDNLLDALRADAAVVAAEASVTLM